MNQGLEKPSRDVGLCVIQPPVAAGSLREFYSNVTVSLDLINPLAPEFPFKF